MSERTRIYPIFLPHQGCPFQCIYCNQHAVTSASAGTQHSISGLLAWFHERLQRLAEDSRRAGSPGEIAFYGGTFTALPSEIMQELLEGASLLVREGLFTGIRFSTRPDCVTPLGCSLLCRYPVKTVELGVQSLSDDVLRTSGRGYSCRTVETAAALVRSHGWSLGIQMMPGLPGDTRERFLESMRRVIALRPDLARIYPTVVLSDTPLAELYRRGGYQPLSLEEALSWCVPAYDALLRAGIPVARMGLHADPELQKPGVILAGPYHPSFGYLVRVHWWRDRVDGRIQKSRNAEEQKSRRQKTGEPSARQLTIRVTQRQVSELLGPDRSNIRYWKEKWQLTGIRIMQEPEWPLHRFECVK